MPLTRSASSCYRSSRFSILSFGEIALITDGAMEGAKREDFVTVARAKGAPSTTIRDRHAGRTALLPALSKLIVSIPFFLTGLMIIEMTFQSRTFEGLFIPVPGLANVLFGSLEERNIPLVIGGLLAVGLIVLGLRLMLDVLHVILDPRLRLEGTQGS